jgi:hypothetical protein
MKSIAQTVEQYIDELSSERKPIIHILRTTIASNIPE